MGHDRGFTGNMTKLSKNQEKKLSLLNKLKKLFTKPVKEIYKIRVIAGSRKFWVKNPKKIIYWKTLSEKQTSFAFKRDSVINSIRITKVIYK